MERKNNVERVKNSTGTYSCNETAQHTSSYDARAYMGFTVVFSPTSAFMATSYIYFWVQVVRKHLPSFGMLVLA